MIDNPSLTYAGPRDLKPAKTGIDKRPAPQGAWFDRLGVEGDTICDTANHGGPDQAVYAYATEDARWWRAELGAELRRPIGPGAFGENLTTDGVDVSGAVIGERWHVGSAVLEVSVPRIPCSTFAGFWDLPRWTKRFTVVGRCGAYLRVLGPGRITAGDAIDVRDRPDHGVTIAQTFRALTGEHSLAPRLLEADQLPADVRAAARRWLGDLTAVDQ
ncbi:MAG: MOSC domain-containing protein [Actinobacteria bacterium]|nr:MOSC domain-containing protein [Actinomycetota bacterium]